MRSVFVIALAVAPIVSGCANESSASAELIGGASVTMLIRPMSSLHSDVHRRLAIEAADERISTDLLDDTGWWRGSNLYRHESGAYVLHEGQAGCIVFTTSPVALSARSDISCEKYETTLIHGSSEEGQDLADEPKSKFYPDFVYIGSFVEMTGGEVTIRFLRHDEKPEAELPEIL